MTTLLQDIRYAYRVLLRSPGFSTIAILTLAVGIGANTALFSVVNGVLLNPLAYPHSGELAAIYETTPSSNRAPTSYLKFLDWQRDTRAFSSIAIYRNEDYTLTGTGQPERRRGYMISASFFHTLGVRPILGRTFQAEDDRIGSGPVVILGGGIWKRRFDSSPAIVGKAITLGGRLYTVVGVVPPGFTFYGQHYEGRRHKDVS